MPKLFHLLITVGLYAVFSPTLFGQNYSVQRPHFEISGEKIDIPELGGLNSPQFANIDLNLDGVLDILVLEKNSGRLIPIIRYSDHYRVNYEILPLLPPIRDWIICKDFNNDGRIDLFTSTPGGIAVYQNASQQTFSLVLKTELINSERNYENQSFSANIFVSSSDIPLIEDLDGDGDLDILTFALGGNTIEHHKNQSVEQLGTANLNFKLVNSCYAYVTDDFTGTSFDLAVNECPDNVVNPEKRLKHSGFTFNFIPGSPKSLLVGELTSEQLVRLYLNPSSFGADSATSQEKSFPSNAPDNLIFIASYSGFFDLDNSKDLILTSNTRGSANINSVYLYSENGDQLIRNNFLQSETIDEGEHASVSMADWDNDGDLDMIISSAVRNDFLEPRISFWENFGTNSTPKFKFTKRFDGNFNLSPPINVSSYRNNGELKLLLGNSEGMIREFNFVDIFSNGFDASFEVLQDESDNAISGSANCYPLRTTINGEEILLVGNSSGKIKHFSISNNKYTLESDNYKDINLKGNNLRQELSLSSSSNSLYVFTQDGQAYSFDLNLTSPSPEFIQNFNAQVGARGTATFVDINNDNNHEIIIGTDDGGIIVFSQTIISSVNKNNNELYSNVFPTIAHSHLNIRSTKPIKSYTVYSGIGKLIKSETLISNVKSIDIGYLPNGFYILQLENIEQTESFKFWKQ